MTPDQLIGIIGAHEDALVERKPEGTNRADLRQTIVAFANTVPVEREAVLFVGVRDNGDIQGVQNPDEMQKLIRSICTQDCYPEVKFQAEVLESQDKVIVAIVIPSSNEKPHFAGPAFVRVGSESVAATKQQYDELIASRHDKCRVLQTWRDQLITIHESGYRLQTMLATPAWNATRQGYILVCTPHTIRIRDTSGNHFTLLINQVEISYDEQHHRNKLIIHPG
jgi:hypothetical protein